MMTLSFDLFWSFRSPYCYLALDRILDIHRRYDVEVRVRPVYPPAVRTPDFFQRVHRNYRRYNLLDTNRLAEYYGLCRKRVAQGRRVSVRVDRVGSGISKTKKQRDSN